MKGFLINVNTLAYVYDKDNKLITEKLRNASKNIKLTLQ